MLLVLNVVYYGKVAAHVAKKELHKRRWWAYKWLKRFKEDGLEGLKDLPRSGRPLKVSEKKMYKIRH